MIRQTLWAFFWASYDNAGRIIAASTIWAIMMMACISLPFYSFQLGWLFWPSWIPLLAGAPVATAAVFFYTGRRLKNPDYSFLECWREFRPWILKSWLLGTSAGIVLAVLGLNIAFYAIRGIAWNPIFGALASGLTLWFTVFYLAAMGLVYPIQFGRGCSVPRSLKQAVLLVLDRPWACLAMLGVSAFMAASLILTQAGAVLLLMGLVSMLWNVTYSQLEREREIKEHHVQGSEPRDAVSEYSHRSLRELIRPWEVR